MAGANFAGQVIGRVGPRILGVMGLLVGALGMAIPAFLEGTLMMVVGISITGGSMGVVFVVASATALGQVDPREAGLLQPLPWWRS